MRGWEGGTRRPSVPGVPYHPPPCRCPLDGEDAADAVYTHDRATSAASSLALLRFLPSYQNLAWWTVPLTVTRLDQAVRPPTVHQLVNSMWPRTRTPGRVTAEETRTSSIRHDLKRRRGYLVLPARIYAVR